MLRMSNSRIAFNSAIIEPCFKAGFGNTVSAAYLKPAEFVLLQQTIDSRTAQEQHCHQVFYGIAAAILAVETGEETELDEGSSWIIIG